MKMSKLKNPLTAESGSEFPCDSRGGLDLAVSRKFEGLEPKT